METTTHMLGVPPKSSGEATNRCVMSRLMKCLAPALFSARPARLTSAPHQHVDHDPATARVNDQSSSCRGPARFPLGVAAARSIHPSRQSGASSILARYIWELSDASNEIYSRRSARRESANLVIGAITIKGIRPTRNVGERHIGVWPQQIDGVARQAGRLVLGSPAKNMQRHLVTGAPSRQLGSGGAIDMHLPVHRCQWFEIVLSIDRNPRQPVAAVNMTRSAG